MGIPERRERKKLEVREQIIAAAIEIVGREGFAGLTIRKIADAIEYSPGTLYLHFTNRDDIGRELVRRAFAQLVTYFHAVPTDGDQLQRLDALGAAYIRFAFEHPELYRLIFMQTPEIAAALMEFRPSTTASLNTESSASISPEDIGEHLGDTAFSILVEVVAKLIAQGIFAPADPQTVAEAIWAWMHGLVSLQLACDRDIFGDVDAVAQAIFTGIHRAFQAQTETSHVGTAAS